MKILFTFAFIFVFGLSLTVFAQTKTILNQKQAVEIAEKFVAVNGFTESPANENANLYLEEGENASDLKNILAARLNSIQPKAMIALIKKVDGQSYWSVQFLFRAEKVEKGMLLGREVRMSLNGSKVWLSPEAIPVWEDRVLICIDDEEVENAKKPF